MPSNTYKKAPVLRHAVNKNKHIREDKANFYQLPQDWITMIFTLLNGQQGAQIKIMTVLMGTEPGFSPSEAWICEKTGLSQPSYIRARRALCDKGWLILRNDELEHSIILNMKKVIDDYKKINP